MHNTAFQQKSVLEGFVQGCLCYQMKVVVAKTCDGGLKWETKCYILAVIHLCLVETCHHKKKKKKGSIQWNTRPNILVQILFEKNARKHPMKLFPWCPLSEWMFGSGRISLPVIPSSLHITASQITESTSQMYHKSLLFTHTKASSTLCRNFLNPLPVMPDGVLKREYIHSNYDCTNIPQHCSKAEIMQNMSFHCSISCFKRLVEVPLNLHVYSRSY